MPAESGSWTQVAIPFATFALGSLTTFLGQRYWKRKDVAAQSARALAELTAEWYHELDKLRISLKRAEDTAKAAELVDNYLIERTILPKVIYHVTVLQELKAHQEVVLGVQMFMASITQYIEREKEERTVKCVFDGTMSEEFLSTLRNLDEIQQHVAREAARAT